MLRSLFSEHVQASGFLFQVHPLVKLFFSLLIFTYSLAVNSSLSLLSLYLALLAFLLAGRLGKAVLNILLPAVLLGTSMFTISFLLGSSLENAAIFALRIFIFFHVFIMFGATTNPSVFLRSLHALKLPTQLSMGLLIVFRFVPVLVNEMKTIGTSFSLRKGASRASPGLFYRGIMVPFIYRLFTLADDLTLALHVRGYGSTPRPSTYKHVTLQSKDILFMVGGLIILAALHFITANL